MPNVRLSSEKQVFIFAALSEGMAINTVCRMFKVGKNAVLRVIDETGEAMAVYMRTNFRELPCERLEIDEQRQYVLKHGQRMTTKEAGKGDFWLWCALDSVSRMVVSWHVGTQKGTTATASSTIFPPAFRARRKSPRTRWPAIRARFGWRLAAAPVMRPK